MIFDFNYFGELFWSSIWPSNSILFFFFFATLFLSENKYANKNLFVNVHSSFTDNSQKLENNPDNYQ